MTLALKRAPEKLLIAAAGRRIPVAIRRNPRARRLILRVDEALGLPILTLPSRTALSQAERFLREHIGWLEERLRLLSPPAPFIDGGTFPLRGLPCRIRSSRGRGVIVLERRGDGYVLSVPGEPEFLARRVTDWLKREARRDLAAAVARHEKAVGRKAARIRVADPKSRWGSCSSKRVLTFSWRLVLAPPRVLDYLAAHEVAHLRVMNHGPRFWDIVGRLDPDHEAARAWLNRAGLGLSAVGRMRS
jgi:predicted metal-dependent hydrolase